MAADACLTPDRFRDRDEAPIQSIRRWEGCPASRIRNVRRDRRPLIRFAIPCPRNRFRPISLSVAQIPFDPPEDSRGEQDVYHLAEFQWLSQNARYLPANEK